MKFRLKIKDRNCLPEVDELVEIMWQKGVNISRVGQRVDFCEPIGKYCDRNTGKYYKTTKGLIHYGKDGAHIVPSRP